MQKKLLGIAVAAALASPAAAFAQAEGVQLYGVIDFSVMFDKFDGTDIGAVPGADVSKPELYSSASRFGIRGREGLGGGMSAWFQAEMGVNPFRPSVDGVPNGVNWLGGRDTAIGLDSSWGTIMAGSWGSPYKVAGLQTWNLGTYGIVSHYGLIMNNKDSTGTEASPFCTGTAPGPICGNGVMTEGSPTAFGRRLANTVQYWSPKFAGVQIKLATELSGLKSPNTTTGGTNPTLWSASGVWSGGPFTAGIAWEQHKAFDATGAVGAPTEPKDTGIQIGGKWKGGALGVGAGFEHLKYENNGLAGLETNFTRNDFVVNGTFDIGAGELFAGYSWTPGNKSCGAGLEAAATLAGSTCKDATKAKFITLGYAMNLSKRTKVYAEFGRIDNNVGTNYYYIAGPAGNADGGTGGITAGTDVTTFGIGMQHSF